MSYTITPRRSGKSHIARLEEQPGLAARLDEPIPPCDGKSCQPTIIMAFVKLKLVRINQQLFCKDTIVTTVPKHSSTGIDGKSQSGQVIFIKDKQSPVKSNPPLNISMSFLVRVDMVSFLRMSFLLNFGVILGQTPLKGNNKSIYITEIISFGKNFNRYKGKKQIGTSKMNVELNEKQKIKVQNSSCFYLIMRAILMREKADTANFLKYLKIKEKGGILFFQCMN